MTTSLTGKIDISVIIPAYNEALRLPRYLESIIAYFATQQTAYEVLVVDDGSTDNTTSVADRYATLNPLFRLIRMPANTGKGAAVKAGMQAARGDLRIFADADGATPIGEYERLHAAIIAGADVAIASRVLEGSNCRVEGWERRRRFSACFNFVVRRLLLPGFRDTQCGFKLFTAAAVERIFPMQTISGFSFDVELLVIACRNSCAVVEVPVNWRGIPGSKVRIVRDAWRMLHDLLKIRFNLLKGLYR